jgi:uncharacterized protein (TIGR03790 family)
MNSTLITLVLMLALSAKCAFAGDLSLNQASGIKPEDVAVVVNDQDTNSLEIGDYYLNARNIPRKNLISVSMPRQVNELSEKQFTPIREKILASLSPNIQVIVLLWTTPYAVKCNSITSAITLGYESKYCEKSCVTGNKNPYFNSGSHYPNQDFNMRLSILLPTHSVELAKSIIDKGVLSTFKTNEATAYFLKTKDKNRSRPREKFYPPDLTKIESKKLLLRTINVDFIQDKKDVMFYFTGAKFVSSLETINFMPGAIADHLTSRGGVLYNTSQMSSLKWLEAGATGSYGSVSEPCNYWQKFPNPEVLLKHYLSGDTLVEAYWKSVYWPAQGLFLGEPLAAPYQN